MILIIRGKTLVILVFEQFYLVDRELDACGGLAVDLLKEVIDADDAVLHLRLCCLPNGGTQGDDLLVIAHELAVLLRLLVLTSPLQTGVEEEEIAVRLRHLALHLDLRAVVMAGVERTQAPRQARSHNPIECTVTVHHIVEEVIPGIAVEAGCKPNCDILTRPWRSWQTR